MIDPIKVKDITLEIAKMNHRYPHDEKLHLTTSTLTFLLESLTSCCSQWTMKENVNQVTLTSKLDTHTFHDFANDSFAKVELLDEKISRATSDYNSLLYQGKRNASELDYLKARMSTLGSELALVSRRGEVERGEERMQEGERCHALTGINQDIKFLQKRLAALEAQTAAVPPLDVALKRLQNLEERISRHEREMQAMVSQDAVSLQIQNLKNDLQLNLMTLVKKEKLEVFESQLQMQFQDWASKIDRFIQNKFNYQNNLSQDIASLRDAIFNLKEKKANKTETAELNEKLKDCAQTLETSVRVSEFHQKTTEMNEKLETVSLSLLSIKQKFDAMQLELLEKASKFDMEVILRYIPSSASKIDACQNSIESLKGEIRLLQESFSSSHPFMKGDRGEIRDSLQRSSLWPKTTLRRMSISPPDDDAIRSLKVSRAEGEDGGEEDMEEDKSGEEGREEERGGEEGRGDSKREETQENERKEGEEYEESIFLDFCDWKRRGVRRGMDRPMSCVPSFSRSSVPNSLPRPVLTPTEERTKQSPYLSRATFPSSHPTSSTTARSRRSRLPSSLPKKS